MKIYNSLCSLEADIQNYTILIIQFGKASCHPCKSIWQRLEKWQDNHPVECLYISVDDYPEIASQMNILSVPTIRVYVNGQMTIQKSGYFSLDLILDKIEKYISLLEK